MQAGNYMYDDFEDPEPDPFEDELDYDDDDYVPEYGDGMSDAEADADTLRSAGWGTDEDYGYYGPDE